MGQMINLFYEFDKASVYDIHEVNSSFASGSLKVLYLGDNRNKSHLSKDAVERALPSLKNVPIVCHWDYEAGEIGGHDMEIVSTDDGGLRLRNLTEPCGVVPEHATFRFSVETDDDGVEHEYLIVDNVLLWKRQDVYNHIVNDLDGKVKHSMEINILNGNYDDRGYLNINDFEFTALCLLETCEPCFQGSELEMYSTANFKKKMEQMMAELKEYFSLVSTSAEVNDTQTNRSLTEGGEKTLENNNEMTEEVVRESAEQFQATEDAIEVVEDHSADDAMAATVEPYALNTNIVSELNRAVAEIEVNETAWGPEPRYCYEDCDMDAHEVYCFEWRSWKLYGFNFTVDGDTVSIDPNSKKRKKYAIVDFEGESEDEQTSPMTEMFSKIEARFAELSNVELMYNEANNHITEMESELVELREYKHSIETENANRERAEVLNKFADLTGITEYDELCANSDGYDIAALEEKCFAIRGRNVSNVKFSLDGASPKLIVDKQSTVESEPYGGIVAKYAVNKKN